MTVLQSLHRDHDRMAARGEVNAPEFSREKIVCQILDIREPGKWAARGPISA